MSVFKRDDEAKLRLKKELLAMLEEKKKDTQAMMDALFEEILGVQSDIERLIKDLEKENII